MRCVVLGLGSCETPNLTGLHPRTLGASTHTHQRQLRHALQQATERQVERAVARAHEEHRCSEPRLLARVQQRHERALKHQRLTGRWGAVEYAQLRAQYVLQRPRLGRIERHAAALGGAGGGSG